VRVSERDGEEDHLWQDTCCHNLPPRVTKCAFVAHYHDDVADADDDAGPVQSLEFGLAKRRMWQCGRD